MKILLTLAAMTLAATLRADPLIPIPYLDPTEHSVGEQVFIMDPQERLQETMEGVTFQLSFDLKSTGLDPSSFFQVYWDGFVLFNLTETAPFQYQTFTFTSLEPSLDFNFQMFSDNGSSFATFRNISIQQTSGPSVSVPESASNALLILAFGALAFWKRASK